LLESRYQENLLKQSNEADLLRYLTTLAVTVRESLGPGVGGRFMRCSWTQTIHEMVPQNFQGHSTSQKRMNTIQMLSKTVQHPSARGKID